MLTGPTQNPPTADEARPRVHGVPAARRIASALFTGLSIAFAIACFMQAQAVLRDRAAEAAIDASREAAVASIKSAIDAARADVLKALDDDELRAAVSSSDESSRARARLRVRERVQNLAEVSFYGPDLLELLSGDLAKFGYSRANLLTQAKTRGGSADALYLDVDGRADRVRRAGAATGDRVVAFVHVVTRAPGLLDPITAPTVSGGTLSAQNASSGDGARGLVGTEGDRRAGQRTRGDLDPDAPLPHRRGVPAARDGACRHPRGARRSRDRRGAADDRLARALRARARLRGDARASRRRARRRRRGGAARAHDVEGAEAARAGGAVARARARAVTPRRSRSTAASSAPTTSAAWSARRSTTDVAELIGQAIGSLMLEQRPATTSWSAATAGCPGRRCRRR